MSAPNGHGEIAPLPDAIKDGQSHALVARQQHEIQSAILAAKAYPRDEAACFARLARACDRPSFADRASYAFPRGGQTVTGPSVNLAREAARCWGNMRYGVDQLPSEDGIAHLEAWALDLESGTKVTAHDRFRKLIQRKKRGGGTEWREPDERDLRELVNRRGALALRNCILQLLPVDLIEEALLACDGTLSKAAHGELKESRETTVRKLLRAFEPLAVSQEMIEAKIGHKAKDLDGEELAELRKVYVSMRDGNSSREDHFEVEAPDQQPAESAGPKPVDLTGLAQRLAASPTETDPGPASVSP